jgi:hypothetical protein
VTHQITRPNMTYDFNNKWLGPARTYGPLLWDLRKDGGRYLIDFDWQLVG